MNEGLQPRHVRQQPGRVPSGRPRSRASVRRSWTGFACFMLVSLVAILGTRLFTGSSAHAAGPAPASKGAPRAATDAQSAAPRHAAEASSTKHRSASTPPTSTPSTSAPSTSAPSTSTASTTRTAECAGNPATDKELLVSISEQTLWACDGPSQVNTSRVTTGADNGTPTGTFYVQAKEGPQYLNGCSASGCWHDFVHVWIPFDGPYGFHDAPWQTMPFGSPGYTTQGSHGCVHLPETESKWVYNWADVGTRVTIIS